MGEKEIQQEREARWGGGEGEGNTHVATCAKEIPAGRRKGDLCGGGRRRRGRRKKRRGWQTARGTGCMRALTRTAMIRKHENTSG